MDRYEPLGFTAGVISTLSAVPQVYKIYITKSAISISWWFLIVQLVGLTLYLIYGVLIAHPAIYSTISLSILLNIAIVIMKRIYDKEETDDNVLLIMSA